MKDTSRFDSYHLIGNRQVRIFLSSTFRDMKEERTALMKSFEVLRIKANRRNVDLCFVDLRWGVTEEESESGKTISRCLCEIERSYPFFIGLLGNHYGTSLDSSVFEKNPDLKVQYPWLVGDITAELSITEIEMRYGVLRNKGNHEASFYIKQTSEPDDNPRLSELKREIYQQKRCTVSDYADIDELCNKVELAVEKILDRYFPETNISSFERERTTQLAYINSRHAHYIKKQSYFYTIDTFVHSQEQNLVFTGESGIGKSALLANWVKENENRDEFNLVYHFVGNSFSDNNYENILRRLCDEIYNLYPIEKQSNHFDTIEEEAQHLLNLITVQEKSLVIVIDGINQIVTINNEKLLLWLPVSNDKVKYIFSTLDDDETMYVFQRRGYRVETVAPLSSKERECFALEYLDGFGKRLSENLLQRIINDAECENTLVLKSLLDELICFGSYEQLESRINYYLSATSIPDFFDRVLIRMEEDYSANQDLVHHVLTLISVSERGLSEEEIMAIVDCQERDWKLFFCAFYNHFIIKDGIISLSHQYVTHAITNRYALSNTDVSAQYRQEIVTYFAAKKPVDEIQQQRYISELAHQYYNLVDWPNLHNTLLSIEAFNFFYSVNVLLLAKYWKALITADNNHYRLSDYLCLLEQKDAIIFADSFSSIGCFVSDYFGEYKTAIDYHLKSLELFENVFGKEHPGTTGVYNNLGKVCLLIGDYTKALEYHLKALEIREKVFGAKCLYIAQSYNDIGAVYRYQGDFVKSLEFYFKALAVAEKTLKPNHQTIATIYNNIGLVYRNQGKFDKAIDYYVKALTIQQEVLSPKHPHTATLCDNIGVVYQNQNNYGKALEFCLKGLALREEVLGIDHPEIAKSYNNIGSVYFSQGDYNNALKNYIIAMSIREKTLGTEHLETAQSYNNIGVVYSELEDYNEALKYYKNALSIREKLLGTDHIENATTYNNVGVIYRCKGDYTNALESYFKALTIQERILGSEHSNNADLYDNIGAVYNKTGDENKALEYYLKALAIREKIFGVKYPDNVQSYQTIASLYYRQYNYTMALEYYLKALAIVEIEPNNSRFATAMLYSVISETYRHQSDYKKALEYAFKALEINERFNGVEHIETAAVNNIIGLVYDGMGRYDKALEYFLKTVEIREKVLGTEHVETAAVYNNIGIVYDNMGKFDKALEFFLKSLAIYITVLGVEAPSTANSYQCIGAVYQHQGILTKAIVYYLEALAIEEKVLGVEHPDVASTYNNIGTAYRCLGDYNKALEYGNKALAINEKVFGTEHLQTASNYNNIGFVYDNIGQHDKALEYYFKALPIIERDLGVEHPNTASLYNNFSHVYYNKGDFDKALDYINKAYLVYRKVFGPRHPNTIESIKGVFIIKEALGLND